jgi:hypothetical protein
MRRGKGKYIKYFSCLLVSVVCLLSTAQSHHAHAVFSSLYFSPSTGGASIGDTLSVTVFVNSSDEAMNTVDGQISFSTDLLEYSSITTKGGIIKVWTTRPEINDSVIDFGGGMPSPGYKGPAGRLFTINFIAKARGTARISFNKGRVFANDGKATNMNPSLNSAEFIIGRSSNPPTNTPAATTPTHADDPEATPNSTKSPTPTGEVLSASSEKGTDAEKDNGDTSVASPEVTEHLKVVTKKEKFFYVKGKTKYPLSEVIITVIPEGNDHDRKKYSIITDGTGDFEYTAPSQWTPGKYSFWTEVVSPEGKHSTRSETLQFEIKAYKTEGIIQQIFDFVPIVLLLIAFTIMIVQLVKKSLANRRINKHLAEATAEVRLEREQKAVQTAPVEGDVQQKTEPDPRIKDK